MKMKFLSCTCCGFLAVIPDKDDEHGLLCPFCTRVKCEHGGGFQTISEDKFMSDAGLAPRPEVALWQYLEKKNRGLAEQIKADYQSEPQNDSSKP